LTEPGTPSVAIVADDLTGALDASAPFAARGLKTLVATAPLHLAAALARRPEVVAVSTNSREGDRDAAVARIAAVAQQIAGVPHLLKKIDSRLKGHVAAEAEALARSTGRTGLVICPALPELGRVVRGGFLSGFGLDRPIPVAEAVAGTGLPVAIADAASPQDLRALVGRAGQAPKRLLVGARSLADALADSIASAPPAGPIASLPAPMLIAIGSRDPITLAQLAALRSARPELPLLHAPNGVVTRPGAQAGPIAVAQVTAGPWPDDSATVHRTFADGLAALVRDHCRTLVVTGGATAAAIVDRLGIGVLDVLGEVAVGLPLSEAVFDGQRLLVVTKSGGFGESAALLDLTSRCAVPDGLDTHD
jgi:D-threonate/D-erythronate kinase